jgi:hypothetical protein
MNRPPLRRWSSATAALALAACLTPPANRPPSVGGEASPTQGDPTETAAYRWRNVQILGGGFVTGVTFSPLVKGLLYARTDVGGAYRLDPGSAEWVPLTDWLGRKTRHDPRDDDRSLDEKGRHLSHDGRGAHVEVDGPEREV